MLWFEPALSILWVPYTVLLNPTLTSFNTSRIRWLVQWLVLVDRTEPIAPILARLHWLPISDRIQYKITLLAHKVLTANQPEYLDILIHYLRHQGQMRSSSHRLFQCLIPRMSHSKNVSLQELYLQVELSVFSLPRESGTVYHMI